MRNKQFIFGLILAKANRGEGKNRERKRRRKEEEEEEEEEGEEQKGMESCVFWMSSVLEMDFLWMLVVPFLGFC